MKVKSPLGMLRGKLGGVIFYKGQDGESLARSYAKPTNRNTEKQKKARGTFSKITEIAKMVRLQWNALFEFKKPYCQDYQMIISANRNAFITTPTGAEVDKTKFTISDGSINAIILPVQTVLSNTGTNIITTLKYDLIKASIASITSPSDKIILFAIDSKCTKTIFKEADDLNATGDRIFTLDNDTTGLFYVYAFLQAADRTKTGKSNFIGEITI